MSVSGLKSSSAATFKSFYIKAKLKISLYRVFNKMELNTRWILGVELSPVEM
jgi:hypothetical protein